jgi:hypothetical protein
MITHLFFDIDGTINPCPTDASFTDRWGWGPEARSRRAFVSNGLDSHVFTLYWSPVLIDEINAIVAQPEIVPHWLTTWEELSRTQFSRITGLNGEGWDVVGEPEYAAVLNGHDPEREWWKITALRRWWSEQEGVDFKVAWCDDELVRHGALMWLSTLPQDRVARFTPSHSLGLSPDHIADLRKWSE